MFKFLESTFGTYHDITTKQKGDDILEILVSPSAFFTKTGLAVFIEPE
jgi:hypothetical protein